MADNLNISNISYTNKDFLELYPELMLLGKDLSYKWDPTVSNEADPGVVLLKEMAILGDKNNYNCDKNALENFPLSVTQEENAREIFELCGYYPKWYVSTLGTANLAFTGDTISPESATITLPLFTMITDAESEHVYTIIGKPTITADGTITSTDIIEGLINQLQINSNPIISLDMLDEDNRIYIPDYNVAQNGIYIFNYNEDLEILDYWTKVNNLGPEKLNLKIYSFGVDTTMGQCYLEFPSDIANLIKNGLSIYYITSTGVNGLTSTGNLTLLYNGSVTATVLGATTIGDNDVSTLSSSTVDLTTDSDDANISVSNVGTSTMGSNPETIDDMYVNYNKVKGTFNTLVTLRDYEDAIFEVDSGCSNVKVCDRTNDVQDSYRIVRNAEGLDTIQYEYSNPEVTTRASIENKSIAIDGSNVVIDGTTYTSVIDMLNGISTTTHDALLDPFDLKIYAFLPVSDYTSNLNYFLSFSMIDAVDPNELGTALSNILENLSLIKCISHNYGSIEPNKPALLTNLFTVDCIIKPIDTVSALLISEIKTNIQSAIFEKYNSRAEEFGVGVDYSDLYNTILNADYRISSINLSNIEYYTFVNYYNKSSNESDPISHSDYYNFLLDDIPEYDSTTTYVAGDIVKKLLSATDTSFWNYGYYICKLDSTGTFDTTHWQPYVNTNGEFKYAKDNSLANDVWKTVCVSDDTSAVYIDAYYNYSSTPMFYWDAALTKKVDTSYFNSGTFFRDITPDPLGNPVDIIYGCSIVSGSYYFYVYSTSRTRFRNEILAKNILCGTTPLISYADNFTRKVTDLSSEIVDTPVITGISHIETDANLDFMFNPGESNVISKTVPANSTVLLSRINLLDDTTFSTYIKYEFVLYGDDTSAAMSSISSGNNYILKDNEYILFYSSSSDSTNYTCNIYGPGTIICPSGFTLTASSPTAMAKTVIGIYNKSKPTDNHMEYVFTDTTSNESLATLSLSSLSSSYSVVINTLNLITLGNTSAGYYYFITSDVENNTYKMRFKKSSITGNYEYILGAGEYFIHTNKAKTTFEVLGSGTLIELLGTVLSDNDNEVKTLTVNYIKPSKISWYGIYALSDNDWLYVSAHTSTTSTINTTGDNFYFKITEREFINVSEGGTLLFAANSTMNAPIKVTMNSAGTQLKVYNVLVDESSTYAVTDTFIELINTKNGAYDPAELDEGAYICAITYSDNSYSISINNKLLLQDLTSISNYFTTYPAAKSFKVSLSVVDSDVFTASVGLAMGSGSKSPKSYIGVDAVTGGGGTATDFALKIKTLSEYIAYGPASSGSAVPAKTFTEEITTSFKLALTYIEDTPESSYWAISSGTTPITDNIPDGIIQTILGTTKYYDTSASDIASGDVLSVSYSFVPSSDLTLAYFSIGYKLNGDSSYTYLNTGEPELSWTGAEYLSVDISSGKYQELYSNQTIKFYTDESNYTEISGDSVNPVLILSSVDLAVDGTSKEQISVLQSDGTYQPVEFYVYKSAADDNLYVNASTNNLITLSTVADASSGNWTFNNFATTPGNYMLVLDNLNTDFTTLNVILDDGTAATTGDFIKIISSEDEINGPVAITSPSGNPAAQNWYIINDNDKYVLTEDTTVLTGTTYYSYTGRNPYALGWYTKTGSTYIEVPETDIVMLANIDYYTAGYLCWDMSNTTVNFNDKRKHFIKFTIYQGSDETETTIKAVNITIQYQRTTSESDGYDVEYLTLHPVIKYVDNDELPNDCIYSVNNVWKYIKYYDFNNIYNYAYEYDENNLILNPLLGNEFNNSLHFYNPYTICEASIQSMRVRT